ncbi:STAS domain-containing protein [Alteromonas sp. 5E99-2]|uniref:STAS domain-containing protein n=1 Tax=Alteromonas sp. 5E99-2 TaxID=2817683 RepID=UPI001A97F403|nr:STAS domain-containing protein [Alteromonas sp. 5E99-2]MBO1256126.1 STAS domain-containing protein [Alteromonas sp. 5E99-2]
MPIEAKTSSNNTELTIEIDSKFDFTKVEEFRMAYSETASEVRKVVVDLQKTEYMDSSALGMLLNMQRFFDGKEVTFDIKNCQQQIFRILTISRFDKKFNIK